MKQFPWSILRSSGPSGRKEFLIAAVFVLTVCKALAVAAFLLVPRRPGLDLGIIRSLLVVGVFMCPYARLAEKRFDAMGVISLGWVGSIAVVAVLLVWDVLAGDAFWLSPVHYAIQAVLLLSLALFRDKPVSGTGWVLGANGTYEKPEDHADLEA